MILYPCQLPTAISYLPRLCKWSACSNIRPNMFILHEPKKCCSNKHQHIFSMTKCFHAVAPDFTGHRLLEFPTGGLLDLRDAGEEVSPLDLHGTVWSPCGSRACLSASGRPWTPVLGHLINRVRLPAPGITTGHKATVMLPRK